MAIRLSEFQLHVFRLLFERKGHIPYHELARYTGPSINSLWNNKWLTYDSKVHEFVVTLEGWRVGQRSLTGRDVQVFRKHPGSALTPTITGDLPTSALKQSEVKSNATKRRKTTSNHRKLQKSRRTVARAGRDADDSSNATTPCVQ